MYWPSAQAAHLGHRGDLREGNRVDFVGAGVSGMCKIPLNISLGTLIKTSASGFGMIRHR
jgi:hypothetical protein